MSMWADHQLNHRQGLPRFYKDDLRADLLEPLNALYNKMVNLTGVNLAFVTLLPKSDCDLPL
jgi:hypothetical protein